MRDALATHIKRYATEVLGFDLVGIAPATPPPEAAYLPAWLAAGRHGDMAYLAATAHIRGDPRRFLPGAQAVVCVAVSYHEPVLPTELVPPPGHALIARYARRRDYHDVIRARLRRLGAFLRSLEASSAFRVAVDTGPLLEKALAARAGLGWLGKHTLLVNRELGSELLLGALVTTTALPADEPAAASCGSCHACLDACPTGALVAPFQLDARRCIAYLTLEYRGVLRSLPAGDSAPYLAGCDRCQLACPLNLRARPRRDPALASRPELDSLSLTELAPLDEEGWRRLRRGTPLRRLSFLSFRRNLEAIARAEQRSP